MSQRIEKVNSLLRQKLATLIAQEFSFPDAVVTLTRVETSGNLFEAKVYVSVMPQEKTDQVLTALTGQIRRLQQEINKLLKMRPVPRIAFFNDDQLAQAAHIEELLGKLKKEEK